MRTENAKFMSLKFLLLWQTAVCKLENGNEFFSRKISAKPKTNGSETCKLQQPQAHLQSSTSGECSKSAPSFTASAALSRRG